MADRANPKSYVRRISNFLRRPLRDQWLFVKAYLLLGISRLAIKTVTFERLARYLGASKTETPTEVPAHHLFEAQRVGRIIRAASRYTPWKSNCFPQAIAAKYLLHTSGINSTLYLGATFKKNKSTEMEAHAWLRCGSIYVTGGELHSQFGVVGIFSG